MKAEVVGQIVKCCWVLFAIN